MSSYVDKCEIITDFKGYQPSADHLPKKLVDHIRGEFLEEYQDFFQAQLTSECVDNARERLSRLEGISIGSPSKKPFFVTDRDLGVGGAEGKSFAFVKPGNPNAGLKIAAAHTDAPCLRISGQPIYIEVDAEKCLLCPGFYLTTDKVGGVRTQEWLGMNVIIKGSLYSNGGERRVSIPGTIRPQSYHVDEEGADFYRSSAQDEGLLD